MFVWRAQKCPRPQGAPGGPLRALLLKQGSKFSCTTLGPGDEELVAHLSGSSAERPCCLGIFETVPGRLGRKTPGSANRGWGGNLESVQPRAFTEMQKHGGAELSCAHLHRCARVRAHTQACTVTPTLPLCTHVPALPDARIFTLLVTRDTSTCIHEHLLRTRLYTHRHTRADTHTLKPRAHSEVRENPQTRHCPDTQGPMQSPRGRMFRFAPTCAV